MESENTCYFSDQRRQTNTYFLTEKCLLSYESINLNFLPMLGCFFLHLWKCCPPFTSCEVLWLSFLVSENDPCLSHEAYNIMWCLQSPHKFMVAAPLHHQKNQGNVLCLKKKAWAKFKNKTKGTNDERNTCHTKNQKPKQQNKKLQHKLHPDLTVKEILFEKKNCLL